jgi:RNA-directed DNA polymerase
MPNARRMKLDGDDARSKHFRAIESLDPLAHLPRRVELLLPSALIVLAVMRLTRSTAVAIATAVAAHALASRAIATPNRFYRPRVQDPVIACVLVSMLLGIVSIVAAIPPRLRLLSPRLKSVPTVWRSLQRNRASAAVAALIAVLIARALLKAFVRYRRRRLRRARRKSLRSLATRLGATPRDIARVDRSYRVIWLAKPRGGRRRVLVPNDELKTLQRRVNARILSRLRAHPAVHSYRHDSSHVAHAAVHVRSDVIVKFDLQRFFDSVKADRAEEYFRKIGYTSRAARCLVELTFAGGRLPQGAPTSPALSNVLNYRMDARLDAVAALQGARYSRYSDDLVFSWPMLDVPNADVNIGWLFRTVGQIVASEGYLLNRSKTKVMRRGTRQIVGGIVVNERPALPREVRRRLRAMSHYRNLGRELSISPESLDGHLAYADHVRSSGD